MDAIAIIDASEVSVEDYRNLRLEALREEPESFGTAYNDQKDTPISEWQIGLDRYVEGEKNWMVFASIDEKLIGMIGAYQTDEDVLQKTACVIAAYVTKEARGKGISKLLMQKLLESLMKTGRIQHLHLMVNPEQKAAVKLYEHFGFKTTEKKNEKLGDGLEHEVLVMKKDLT